MLRFFLILFDKYGMDSLQIGLICFFAYKFATNHWKHFMQKIDDIGKGVKSNEVAINSLSNRVSTLEGKLE